MRSKAGSASPQWIQPKRFKVESRGRRSRLQQKRGFSEFCRQALPPAFLIKATGSGCPTMSQLM